MSTPVPAALSIDNLVVRYRRRAEPAVAGVSLRMDLGEWVALLGGNGSGKSTLMSAVLGLVPRESGSIELFGKTCTGRPPASVRRRLGVVFQNSSLDPLLTVRENLSLHAGLFGLAADEARQRIDQLAADAGLTGRLDERAARLSGGLARRADLVRALLPAPALLLLDEPTTGLDAGSRAAFWNTLAGLGRSNGTGVVGPAVLASTHLLGEAEAFDRVCLMLAGRVLADEPPADLRRRVGEVTVRVRPEAVAARASAAGGLVRFAEDQRSEAAEVARRAIELGGEVEVGPPTLESVFLAMTSAEPSRTGDEP